MSGVIQFWIKTSRERSTEAAILVIRIPAVDIRAVGISIAHVHEVTVRVASFFYLFAVCGINETKCTLGTSGTICMSMWRKISRPSRD